MFRRNAPAAFNSQGECGTRKAFLSRKHAILRRQAFTAYSASFLDNLASGTCFGARKEAVSLCSLALLRLISHFCHEEIKIRLYT